MPLVREHRHRLRVLYGDTDTMGVVYYANYLRFFEAGRNELLRSAGVEYRAFEGTGLMLPVTDARARYHQPARYDDQLDVVTCIEKVRMGSLQIGYRVERVEDGVLLTTGSTTHACVDREGRVRRLPAELRAALEAA